MLPDVACGLPSTCLKGNKCCIVFHHSYLELNLKKLIPNYGGHGIRFGIKWYKIRLIWIGYYKNTKNKQCLFSKIPKDITLHILKFCVGD